MIIDVKKVLIITTVPCANAKELRDVLCEAGAGVIGKYTYCTMSTKYIGTFVPSADSNPYIGERNELTFVEEEKIETICDIENVKSVIKKLREVHPYEEPAIYIVPLVDEECL